MLLQVVFCDRESYLSKREICVDTWGAPQWIVVTPVLKLKNKEVSENGLRLMTVLPNSIGPLENWDGFFRRETERGYNAFHIAPMQELGVSNSYYCIKDHCRLNADLVGEGSYEEQLALLEPVLQGIRKKYNC
jgi:hypothetical protein